MKQLLIGLVLLALSAQVQAQNEVPVVTITGPSDDPAIIIGFVPGDPINFTATASDAEDGDISASIQWTSDLSGANITVGLTTEGIHIITAEVTDSGSATGTDTTPVVIDPLADFEVDFTFSADAFGSYTVAPYFYACVDNGNYIYLREECIRTNPVPDGEYTEECECEQDTTEHCNTSLSGPAIPWTLEGGAHIRGYGESPAFTGSGTVRTVWNAGAWGVEFSDAVIDAASFCGNTYSSESFNGNGQLYLDPASQIEGWAFIDVVDVGGAAGTFQWNTTSQARTLAGITMSAESLVIALTGAIGSSVNAGFIADGEWTLSTNPTADAGGPYNVNEGGSVALDGSGSSDLDGPLTAWDWDLDNDGEFDDATGVAPAFSASGLDGPDSRTIGLRVADVDGNTGTASATVNILNVAPTANNDGGSPPDAYTTDENSAFDTGDVRGNDTDPSPGDIPLSVTGFNTAGTVGLVSNNGNGTFNYNPNGQFAALGGGDSATDSFSYTVGDGDGGSDTATVTITIEGIDNPPVAVDDSKTVTEDDPATTIDVLGNDTDVDGGPKAIASANDPANGTVVVAGDQLSLTYEPDDDYCNQGNAVSDTDNFTYTLTPGTSVGTVRVSVTCVNDAPVATDNDYTFDEDTTLSGNVITDGTPDSDVDGDSLRAVLDVDSTYGGLLTFNADGSFSYDPEDDYCNDATPKESFTYHVNDGPTPIDGAALDSEIATVMITVTCLNDPPVVTDVDIQSQTSDYSDRIQTVTVTATDVDDTTLTLSESGKPALSAASLSLSDADCDTDVTPSPTEDGSTCTWTYDGQILHPGTNSDVVTFTANDGHIDGTVTGTHTLNVHPEDATVQLDGRNEVSIEVDAPDSDSSLPFSLHFTAWETNDTGSPQGDFAEALGFMTLAPVGPGGPITVACSKAAIGGSGYGEWTTFKCDYTSIPVNTYEVVAEVDGASDTTVYYHGIDEDAFVVYDPSLGYTTAGGWFYWPGSEITEGPGYPGDRTNLGYTMKYNRKATKVQGSALLQRHTIDPVTCFHVVASQSVKELPQMIMVGPLLPAKPPIACPTAKMKVIIFS
jgi:VCBS repeat-containing protein